VTELRELFKQLIAYRSIFEETGVEDFVSVLGNAWSLWDLEYLFAATSRLTLRQRQVITLCLIHGMREEDAALAMGVSPTNPVMMYASLGLQRLIDMLDANELNRFAIGEATPEHARQQHFSTFHSVARHISSKLIVVQNGCWLYPTTCAREPLLLLRSRESALGYVSVSPVEIMYRARRGPIPRGCTYQHTTLIRAFSLDCVNPYHVVLQLSEQRRREVQALALRWNQDQSNQEKEIA